MPKHLIVLVAGSKSLVSPPQMALNLDEPIQVNPATGNLSKLR